MGIHDATFSMPKTMTRHMINVSVIRDDGARLSFAADDNLGMSKDAYVRTYMQESVADGMDAGALFTDIGPVGYLHALASFLGYTLVPNDARVEEPKPMPFPTRESRPDMQHGTFWVCRVGDSVVEVWVFEINWTDGDAHVRQFGTHNSFWVPIDQLTERSPFTH